MTLSPSPYSRISEPNPLRTSTSPYYLQNGSSGNNARQSAGTIAAPAKSVASKIVDLMFGFQFIRLSLYTYASYIILLFLPWDGNVQLPDTQMYQINISECHNDFSFSSSFVGCLGPGGGEGGCGCGGSKNYAFQIKECLFLLVVICTPFFFPLFVQISGCVLQWLSFQRIEFSLLLLAQFVYLHVFFLGLNLHS